MKTKSLKEIAKALELIGHELNQQGLQDSRIVERFAEYWVARELSLRGHGVQILNEREVVSADIYLPESKIRVEVKSAIFDKDGFAYASFAKGKQITKKKFDFCVFLTFVELGGVKPKDVFIFSLDDLKEIALPRKRLADHPESNSCLLMCGRSLKVYSRQVKEWRVRAYEIEKRLHENPRRFRNRWSKIRRP